MNTVNDNNKKKINVSRPYSIDCAHNCSPLSRYYIIKIARDHVQEEEKPTTKPWSLFFFATGSVLGNTGQVILLDLFIASFHNYDNNCKPISSTAGPFFVLLFCSLLFNIGFWPVVAVKLCASKTSIAITPETWTYTMSKNHWKICMIGVFDALNGFLIVYASSPNRVPSDLQPIVLQTIIPMTILLSFVILRKRYVAWQLVGAGLVVAAVAISLIPTFMDVAKHEKTLRFESGDRP